MGPESGKTTFPDNGEKIESRNEKKLKPYTTLIRGKSVHEYSPEELQGVLEEELRKSTQKLDLRGLDDMINLFSKELERMEKLKDDIKEESKLSDETKSLRDLNLSTRKIMIDIVKKIKLEKFGGFSSN